MTFAASNVVSRVLWSYLHPPQAFWNISLIIETNSKICRCAHYYRILYFNGCKNSKKSRLGPHLCFCTPPQILDISVLSKLTLNWRKHKHVTKHLQAECGASWHRKPTCCTAAARNSCNISVSGDLALRQHTRSSLISRNATHAHARTRRNYVP